MSGLRRWLASARKQFGRDECGASAVEFAIIGSVLVVVILGTIQLGWALQVRSEMSKATDLAARYTLLPDKTEADFSPKVKEALASYDQAKLVVPAPKSIIVDGVPMWLFSVSYKMPVVMPLLPAEMSEITITRRTPDL